MQKLNSGQFKKGMIPHNKGKKGYPAWNKGLHINLNPGGGFKNGHTPASKGKKLPQFSGDNASNWQGGKMTKNCLYCKKEFSFHKFRKDVVKFCSRSCRAKYSTGENSHHWLGGITSKNHKDRTSTEAMLWRKSCLDRDNFTCQKTGQSGGKLHVHHINNFSEFIGLRFAIDNGITLSEESHRLFHKIYGEQNNTKEQLQEFLTIA